jgi:hypothetical protein
VLLGAFERELLNAFVFVLIPLWDGCVDVVWPFANWVHPCGAVLDGVFPLAGVRFWTDDCARVGAVCVWDCVALDSVFLFAVAPAPDEALVRLPLVAPCLDALIPLFRVVSEAVWPAWSMDCFTWTDSCENERGAAAGV